MKRQPDGVGSGRDDGAEPVDLAVLTHRLTSGLNRAFRAALEDELEDARIGPRHRAVLVCLRPGGSRAVDVARESQQHKQVVGTLVDDLEKAGYVRREPDPADRRSKLVVPTDAGLRYLARTSDALQRVERRLASEVGDAAYVQFKQTYQRVVRALATGGE